MSIENSEMQDVVCINDKATSLQTLIFKRSGANKDELLEYIGSNAAQMRKFLVDQIKAGVPEEEIIENGLNFFRRPN